MKPPEHRARLAEGNKALSGHQPGPIGARVVVEVAAGVLPGDPEERYTKRWSISASEWRTLDGPAAQLGALAELGGQAAGYALFLQLQPDMLNWVRMEWVYL